MVDPITGVGSVQNIQSGSKASSRDDKRADSVSGSSFADQVKISDEAADLSQVERIASDVRLVLERDTSSILGLNPGFDTAV